VRAFARRPIRIPPAALVAGRAVSPLPHGPLPAGRIATLCQYRNGLLAAAMATGIEAGDNADRAASKVVSSEPIVHRPGGSMARTAVVSRILFALMLSAALPAGAVTFTVTNTLDAGAGSLRQAIL